MRYSVVTQIIWIWLSMPATWIQNEWNYVEINKNLTFANVYSGIQYLSTKKSYLFFSYRKYIVRYVYTYTYKKRFYLIWRSKGRNICRRDSEYQFILLGFLWKIYVNFFDILSFPSVYFMQIGFIWCIWQHLLENFSLIEFPSFFVCASPTEILLDQFFCFFLWCVQFCPSIRFVIHLPIWT